MALGGKAGTFATDPILLPLPQVNLLKARQEVIFVLADAPTDSPEVRFRRRVFGNCIGLKVVF